MRALKNKINELIGVDQSMISYASADDPVLKRIVINGLELITGRNKIAKAYDRLVELEKEDQDIWRHIFPLLDIELDYDESRLAQIPKNGPLVIIANHPFGVVDGLALGEMISRIREDFLLIVNEVLCREKVLGKYLLPIDFREDKQAIQTNINTRKKAIEHIKNNGVIAIFPSGGVATSPKPFDKHVEDLEWKRFVVKIIKQAKATILPIYFHGQNSRLFQVASHINPNLRLGLLLHEVNNKRGHIINMSLGQPITFENVQSIHRDEILDFLRSHTMSLADSI